jgi:hypothetical protein
MIGLHMIFKNLVQTHLEISGQDKQTGTLSRLVSGLDGELEEKF